MSSMLLDNSIDLKAWFHISIILTNSALRPHPRILIQLAWS